MTNSMFIPKKIRVGFQKRDDTYTKRLAYIIYYDVKGVLRKEKSWDEWRDHQMAAKEFDNTPQDGFVLNRHIERYNWGHFSSNRSYIRVYDPREIEFEITPENLIGILTETACDRRGLEGKFVYAWHGTQLVLLPCGSESYLAAQKYTALQGQDISAKDLEPGRIYITKKGNEVVYLGRHDWYTWPNPRWGNSGRSCKKHHIFHGVSSPSTWNDREEFFPRGDMKFLSAAGDMSDDYAELMDKLKKDIRTATVIGLKLKPFVRGSATNTAVNNRYSEYICRQVGDELEIYYIYRDHFEKGYISREYSINMKDTTMTPIKMGRSDNRTPLHDIQSLVGQGYHTVLVKFSNGVTTDLFGNKVGKTAEKET